MKKLLVLFVLGSLVAGLAGCSGSSDAAKEPAGDPSKKAPGADPGKSEV